MEVTQAQTSKGEKVFCFHTNALGNYF